MRKRLIGVYDYTVILTLLSVMVSVVGMTFAMDHHFRSAVFCLAFSGFLDAFDGKVARTKKNRTMDEMLYGIQLDSLADIVCFGAFPAMICYLVGVRGFWGCAILGMYVICGITRLSYFNVMETNRQSQEIKEEKVYHGLPITSIAVILPLTFLCEFIVEEQTFVYVMSAVMICVAVLFVTDFKMKSLKNWMLVVLIIIGVLIAGVILFFTQYRIPRFPQPEEPLYDQIMDYIEE